MIEMFSPPRVTVVGSTEGLEVGEAMDLITGWDFTKHEDQQRAWEDIKREQPKLIIGSPMHDFSAFCNICTGGVRNGSRGWLRQRVI